MPSFIKFLFFLFTLFSSLIVYSQREEIQQKLAIQYFEEKEYDKANAYLGTLYANSPDRWYYTYYSSLIGAKAYTDAEKLVRKRIRSRRQDAFLYVHLGNVYKLTGDPKKENDAYEKAIRELVPMQPYLQQLSKAFLDNKLFDYALAVYNKGRKANPDYPFFYERAEIFRLKGDVPSMIGEYLDALELRESELITVQNNLQTNLGYDDEYGGFRNPVLKQELQKRIGKNPDKVVLVEFLIFIQKQQKDFNGAFIQSRALDKRLGEQGERMYELARLCTENEDWPVARRCYEYLLAKGPGSVYYDVATIEGLNVEFLALTRGERPSAEELATLEGRLHSAYEKYKHLTMGYQLLRNLIHVQAYYLSRTSEAIAMLESFVQQPGINPAVNADFKLLLGDLYLLSGAIWDASLLYSQVEKDFKYETIGQDAKFRNARLSYYAGDFAWAKAQCDVLKGATSKLIANDALNLSLIITDAIGVDTNAVPLQMFSSAELLMRQHRFREAISRMDSINLLFNMHTLGDDISFKKAEIYIELGEYSEAETMYKNVLQYYPAELYGDDAQFRLAELYDRHLKDSAKAGEAYQSVLINYPGSVFTVEARKRYRILRGDILNN